MGHEFFVADYLFCRENISRVAERRTLPCECKNIFTEYLSSRGNISDPRGRTRVRRSAAPRIRGFITAAMRRLSKIAIACMLWLRRRRKTGMIPRALARVPRFRSNVVVWRRQNCRACISARDAHVYPGIFIRDKDAIKFNNEISLRYVKFLT